MKNISYLCKILWNNIHTTYRMRRLKLFLLAGVIAMTSCTSYKKVYYLQNSAQIDTTTVTEFYDARIQPKDMLTITVSSEKPEAAIPFNLTIPTALNSGNGANRSLTSQPTLQNYLVDNEGYIDFPILGKIHVAGMTKGELEEYVKEHIKSNFTTAPIVTVRMSNYKVTVLGEVNSPGVKTIANEKVNVLEAVAMAGDLTIYGQRDGVKLVRENLDGTKQIIPLDLNDANLIYSPYYYLQQNDILYVEPNKAKARNSDVSSMTSMWFSATSLLMAVITFLLNLL